MGSYSAVLVVILIISVFSTSKGSTWNYGNYTAWPGICQTGSLQSPIDLVPSDTTERVYSAFSFQHYDLSYSGTVKNNGHSIAITLFPINGTAPLLSGGGLPSIAYVLDHIHFHWQSEHMMDGNSFPLEMHLVHYAAKYSSLSEAAENAGIAVLGVFFELSLDDDEDFIPLIEVMDKVEKNPLQEVPLERTISPRSFLPRKSADFFRYQGSLTTPNCNEGVTWTVFMKPLPISADQIAHFEDTWSEDGPLTLNFRPVQPLNGRVVNLRHSPTRAVGGNSGDFAKSSTILIMATLLLRTFTS